MLLRNGISMTLAGFIALGASLLSTSDAEASDVLKGAAIGAGVGALVDGSDGAKKGAVAGGIAGAIIGD